MPGLVLFRRRWAIAADDLVIPSVVLAAAHTVWGSLELHSFVQIYQQTDECGQMLKVQTMGYFLMMCLAVCLEITICCITMRGSIMDTKSRRRVRPILYSRCALFCGEFGWMVFAAVWFSHCQEEFPVSFIKAVLLGTLIFNALLLLIILFGVYLSYDLGGSKWLKLRKYQANVQHTGSKLHHGNNHRTWRTRKYTQAQTSSWNRRCSILFCCLSGRQRTSLGEIAQLLSDFFRDLDLVPSDIVAGLILLRRYQKLYRHALLAQRKTQTYQFLSGAPISQETKFLKLADPKVLKDYSQLVRYMRFSLAVYGWPMYVFRGRTCCKLLDVIPGLRCFCCFWLPQRIPGLDTEQDNCCSCNSSAMWAIMESVSEDDHIQFVHASYTGGVGVTPYFLALDHLEKKVVVTIRGTLSMKDLVTDLNASAEFIPVEPLQTNPPWLAHKGMIAAAEYVKKKLLEDGKLYRLFEMGRERSGCNYDLLLVGHSLGGGTACILAIMLRQDFPTLKCICFSPPGGLLNLPAAEYTRNFVTTCLLGKDIVTRLGLHQLEAMRSDLLNVIQRSSCPKWKILLTSIFGNFFPSSAVDPAIQRYAQEQAANTTIQGPKMVSPYVTTHPPMYLPGNIVQIVRSYPDKKKISKTRSRFCCKKSLRKGEPVYQAIEVERESFYEISLSPSMVDDHMPDTLLSAMGKVLEYKAPAKPRRMQNGFGSHETASPSDPGNSVGSDSTPEPGKLSRLSISSFTGSAPYESDLDLPYVDMSVTSPPAECPAGCPINHRIPVKKQQSYVSQDSDQSAYPSVKIYTSLVEQGTSCYTLGSSTDFGSKFDVTTAEVHTDQPGRVDSRFLLNPSTTSRTPASVSKAKSLTELPTTGKKATVTRKKSVSKDDLKSGSSLQIPTPQFGRRERRKCTSQEILVGGGGGNQPHRAAHVHVKRTSHSENFPLSDLTRPTVPRSHVGSFSSLPDKTRYGTIYYV